MSFQIRFGPEDPLNCRFAVSPSWETQAAVRLLNRPSRWTSVFRPWLRASLPLVRGLGLEPLWLLMPRRGYTPDFLASAPEGPGTTFAREMAGVRATVPERAAREIERALASTPGAAGSALGRELLADPAAAVETLAAAKERAWAALVEPHWPRLRTLLEADVAFHSRRLADGGLARLFSELHPRVTWREGALHIERPSRHVRELRGGEGVTLMPSVFAWPEVTSGFEPPFPAALVYPARGIGGLWAPPASSGRPPEALVTLLGANRAAVLAALDEPAATTALAARLGLAASSVSAHLSALRGAGLLTSYRVRRQVLYERTPLGIALAAGDQPSAEPAAEPSAEPSDR
ncbi:DUF5937 family protein [Streptomyces sp. NPDC048172]|uniref:DUF5937 family protein n=1 Tax=Streptomyces sp. NPDC048172 TaxID=3365505 RepID=UPI003721D8DC